MTNTALNYDLAFVDTISTLAPINTQLIFRKEKNTDGKMIISLKANNIVKTVLYELEAPESSFNFAGTTLAMVDYNKFKQYITNFRGKTEDKKPILTTQADELGQPLYLYIKPATTDSEFMNNFPNVTDSRFRLNLANEDTIMKPCFKTIDHGSADTQFKLSAGNYAYIKKMISMVGANLVTFSINGSLVTVTCLNQKSADVFKQTYIASIEAKTPFEVKVPANAVSSVPDYDYDITIDKEGLVVLTQERTDGIKLTLFIAEV